MSDNEPTPPGFARHVLLMGRSYDDLAKLARVCANNAYIAMSREVAREFWRMALEYQHKAATLGSGNLPDIGPSPAWFKE